MTLMRILTFIFALLVLNGCDMSAKPDLTDLTEFVDTTFKDSKPKIEPLPPVEPYEEFIYKDEAQIDPFDIANVRIGESVEEEEEGVSVRNREPLESYSLESIRMDGIINFNGELSALVKTSDGVFPVKVGNYIGLNEGEIISIDSESHIVKIRERVRSPIGGWKYRTAKLQGHSNAKGAN